MDAGYGEEAGDKYLLYKNDSTNGNTIKSAMAKLSECTLSDSEGLNTPMTFLYDFDKIESEPTYFNRYKITCVVLNYIALINGTENLATKTQMIRDMWNYGGIFSPDYVK